jgi:hypothetical protein
MARVFISYSSKDRAEVYKIEQYLRLLRHEPSVDEFDVQAGRDLTVALQSKISSADCFCPILTPDSVASTWVIPIELPFAIDRKLRIIPVLLRKCQIPVALADVRHVDFSNSWERGLIELVNSLPRGDYDEVQVLRKTFRETPLGAGGRSVSSFLEAVVSRKRHWKDIKPKKLMEALSEAPGSKGHLNDIYWWLMVHGVFRFVGISSDEMCNAAELWKQSIQCAELTPRGAALLNDLALEVATRTKIRQALKKR